MPQTPLIDFSTGNVLRIPSPSSNTLLFYIKVGRFRFNFDCLFWFSPTVAKHELIHVHGTLCTFFHATFSWAVLLCNLPFMHPQNSNNCLISYLMHNYSSLLNYQISLFPFTNNFFISTTLITLFFNRALISFHLFQVI